MDRIAVVGGGTVGSRAARALHRRGRGVVVPNPKPPRRAASRANTGRIVPPLATPAPPAAPLPRTRTAAAPEVQR